MGFIYKITNTVNNKCYIGETVQIDPEKRWKKHISSATTTKDCPALAGAMNKYGIDKFNFEILIICFDEDRFEYEKEYIMKYNSQRPNGYNILDGGQYGGSRLGTHLSMKTKEKISKSLRIFYKNNPNNFEKYRDKHANAMRESDIWRESLKERTLSQYTISEKSDEVKDKISKGVKLYFEDNNNKERHIDIMTKINGRKVSQYSKENTLISQFDSIVLASKHTGIERRSIQSNLAGRSKSSGGFVWKYVEKELKE